jgi:hypothetical protein
MRPRKDSAILNSDLTGSISPLQEYMTSFLVSIGSEIIS